MACYFYPARSAGLMTCYFGKLDRIAVGAMILPKIPKIAFHDTNSNSLGVALSYLFLQTLLELL